MKFGTGESIHLNRSLLRPFVLLIPKSFKLFDSNISILRVPDESYSRNTSCALNLISMFLLLVDVYITQEKLIYKTFLFLKTWARPLSISECVRHL